MADSEATPQKVWDLALGQIYDKLNGDEELPPYVLKEILATIARVKKDETEAKPAEEQVDALASLESLPEERQLELLNAERARIFAQLRAIDQRMEKICGNDDTGLAP